MNKHFVIMRRKTIESFLSLSLEPILDGFGRDLREVGEAEEVDGSLERVRIGAGEQIEVRISGDRDSFQNNHGPSQKGKVVRHAERKYEEDFVELVADGEEPFVSVEQNLQICRVILENLGGVVVQLLEDFQQGDFVNFRREKVQLDGVVYHSGL